MLKRLFCVSLRTFFSNSMNKNLINSIVAFVGYFLFHVFVARKMYLGGVAFNYVYVGYLLTLNPSITKSQSLLVAFSMGLLIDWFEYSPGIHASACVFLAFIRPYLIGLLAARTRIDVEEIREISIREIDFVNFVLYANLLILFHHFIVFSLEAWTSKLLWLTLQKTFFSTIFTLISVILVQYLFFSSKR